MADNVTLPLKGQGDVTARTATEDITGTHFQKVKLIDGTAGSTTALPLSGDLTNGLDVDVTRVSGSVAVTGTFWQTTQPVSGTFWQATQPVSGTFWQTTQPVSIATMPSTPVTGTFWQTTQPVSLATAPSTPVTGTFWQATQPVSLATAPSTPVTGTFWQATQPVSGTFWQATQPVSLATAPSTPVTGTFWQATQPVSGTFWQTTQPVSGTVNPTTSNRSDTYSATGNGVTVDVSATPLKSFAVQVIGTGAAASLWDIRLEGSLDNVNFTQILQHTNTTGDGVVLYSGATLYPSLYFRSRCAGLTLGAATNVVVKILGT